MEFVLNFKQRSPVSDITGNWCLGRQFGQEEGGDPKRLGVLEELGKRERNKS